MVPSRAHPEKRDVVVVAHKIGLVIETAYSGLFHVKDMIILQKTKLPPNSRALNFNLSFYTYKPQSMWEIGLWPSPIYIVFRNFCLFNSDLFTRGSIYYGFRCCTSFFGITSLPQYAHFDATAGID